MSLLNRTALNTYRRRLRSTLSGPQILAFLPAVTLAAFWLGGEPALLACALGLPAAFALAGSYKITPATPSSVDKKQDAETFADMLQMAITSTPDIGRGPACLLLEIDDFAALTDRYGSDAAEQVLHRTHDRLELSQRESDVIYPYGNGKFGVFVAPEGRMSLDGIIQISQRLQNTVADAIALDGTTVYVSASVGFCLAGRAPERTGASLLKATQAALTEALHHGPAAVRAFTPDVQAVVSERSALNNDLITALDSGDIQAWYQPQISTDTGEITGLEALARWHHPTHGYIPPSEFIPLIEDAGLSEQLTATMLIHGLTALQKWDARGCIVPKVGVNFSSDELRNPKLVDQIKWELDRFDLTPDRLTIEVLETVIAGPGDDVITRNLTSLSKLGCGIDLDDFGTGHASIANIRRFSVNRIKVDRSLVTKMDSDPDQQRLMAAILVMAEQLEIDTLAEGVETVEEHAMLCQLGCSHVQGFGIGRPMPFDKCTDWIHSHNKKISRPASIGRYTG
ncbi:MAG: GGDEF domain-containing phosphodiesterase [Pseudoruegeria sp.]